MVPATNLMEPDDNDLLAILRAHGSRELQLPHWTTFAPLEAHAEAVDIEVERTDTFSQHKQWLLPCDSGCSAAKKAREKHGREDTIHCLTVTQPLAKQLNERLFEAALQLEAAAAQAAPEDDHAGVQKTNWGGFQSKTYIFDAQDDPTSHDRLSCCRELHSVIVSAALDELGQGKEEYPQECPFRREEGQQHAACTSLRNHSN